MFLPWTQKRLAVLNRGKQTQNETLQKALWEIRTIKPCALYVEPQDTIEFFLSDFHIPLALSKEHFVFLFTSYLRNSYQIVLNLESVECYLESFFPQIV